MRATRKLGLDVGDRWIGVALSDPNGILARPLTIIDRADEQSAIDAILSIVEENQVGIIVAGLPISMDGSMGPQAEKVKDFVQELGKRTQVPLKFWDERLTTLSAQKLMKMKKKGNRARDDALAAAFILQEYLDERA